MDDIAVKILTFEAEKCSGMAKSIKITTEAGEIMILPSHANLISTVNLADIEIVWNNTHTERFLGRTGIISVNNTPSTVTVLLSDCDKLSDVTKTSLESYLETINTALEKGDLSGLQQKFYLDQKTSLEQGIELISSTA